MGQVRRVTAVWAWEASVKHLLLPILSKDCASEHLSHDPQAHALADTQQQMLSVCSVPGTRWDQVAITESSGESTAVSGR